MKKIFFVVLIFAILLTGCKNNNEANNQLSDEMQAIKPPEPLAHELIIRNPDYSRSFEINEYEKELFLDQALLDMYYLEYVTRLIYDFDTDMNQVVLVYEDQTFIVDLNKELMIINNGEPVENNLFENKAGRLYVNLETFKTFFPLEWMLIEEPLFSLQLSFNTEREKNPVMAEISERLEALPEYINMTWEAVYSGGTNVDNLYEMPGLDIISPVWYDLTDGTGRLKSKKQDDYIEWAQSMGYTLWPAVTNGFDTDMTHELLNSIENRTAFIDKLLNIYVENGFPGINIDFENIYLEDRDALSQFIAELTAAFHRAGIIVSMDVTFAGGSDTWSKCYDRYTLGEWVDFIVVMSYDQHWGSSPVSGTVAGVKWVDENLNKLTKEVNSSKIIMGIPFYMRVWFERPSQEYVNQMRVTSDAITMHKMESILAAGNYTLLWDADSGQNYISFIDPKDNALKKIWIEDETSLALKVELVHKYNLKGIASWRRGYETENIWPMLELELRR